MPLISVQEVYSSVVEYFGENPKTTQPAMFFPIFARFIKAYKVRVGRTGFDSIFFYMFAAAY